MKTVHIDASKSYDVRIGRGLLDDCGRQIAERVRCASAAVVADDTVYALYGERVCASLEAAGIRTVCYVFPHGEKSKNLLEYAKILNFLAENRVTRADALIALGGGVTGDLGGFAAATYLRGIPFVQLPTTLLAAVDSSVGGKTAVDLPAGKNLAGAFYQPELVLCDLDTLDSLPREIFLDGCAEVIKYAVLGSRELFALLADIPSGKGLEEVTARCVEMKRDFVQSDELDRGARQMLNLGHTFGHAVEASSRFTLSHGKSVAIGMAMILRAACSRGLCSAETRDAVIALLQRYGLPTECPYPADMLLGALSADKKIFGTRLNLVVPTDIGACRLLPVGVDELSGWLRDGGAI
ncbi:MAG: 3-dehydroquinate synthase [Oscillospiraceae bacterium]|nr:3-dehydroquinate synthase [Oscillospiraceae bacterium]